MITLLVGTCVARADENPTQHSENEKLMRAFRQGLKGTDDPGVHKNIQIDRFGHTLLLTVLTAKNENQKTLSCVLCSSDEALAKARTLGANIHADASQKATALLHAPDLSEDDRAFVDGVPLVPALASHPVVPGQHTVEVHNGGVASQTEVNLEPGKKYRLEATGAFYPKKSKLRPSVIIAGLGLTTAAIGGLFLWLDGNCSSPESNENACENQHNLTGAGWGLIAGGVVVELGLLIWLLLTENDRATVRVKEE
ncbi:MAG: hypothetical protein GY847_38275 [Proteobacteria bacterium]|nr:hypothetical protein [Pseudomonadota bacterium]